MIEEIKAVCAWMVSVGADKGSGGFLSMSPTDGRYLLNLIGANGFTNMDISTALFDAIYARHGEYDKKLVSTPIVAYEKLHGWFNALARQLAIDELLPELP